MNKKNEQEDFWTGDFGDQYIKRNESKIFLASNISFFSEALRKVKNIDNCIEFGANIGMNIRALKFLFPSINFEAIEINKIASDELSKVIGSKNVHQKSILDYESKKKFSLVLSKTVLIHINPNRLNEVYDKLYMSSKKYILIAEYYNPVNIEIKYRGFSNKLFKRDFAGEILKKYNDLELIDYGFRYHGDNTHKQDDINWFLLEKK